MIRIYKNHITIDTKRSDKCIQDKESSSKVLEILKNWRSFIVLLLIRNLILNNILYAKILFNSL